MRYRYVEAAILSTYMDAPCGPCDTERNTTNPCNTTTETPPQNQQGQNIGSGDEVGSYDDTPPQKKSNLTLKWAHLPFSATLITFRALWQWHSSNKQAVLWLKVTECAWTSRLGTFGPIWMLVKSHTDRNWCMRAQRAYAQVGSKTHQVFVST